VAPTLFVGSSTEALPIAEAVQRIMRQVANVTLWTQGVFGLNQTAFESIVNKSKYFDYAIFIFSRDDTIAIRGNTQDAVRDNVIFELGFFCAVLGSKRCFFLVPKQSESFRIPSDLRGLMYAGYDIDSHHGNIDAAVGSACSDIVLAIRSPGPLTGDWKIYIDGSEHNDPNGTFQIVHAGTKITARLALTKGKMGVPTNRRFVYEGRYLSGQIVLHFEQTDAEDHIIGSMTIRVLSNLREMQGVVTFWHHDHAKMTTEAFKLVRDT
jgi:hypothetical protein